MQQWKLLELMYVWCLKYLSFLNFLPVQINAAKEKCMQRSIGFVLFPKIYEKLAWWDLSYKERCYFFLLQVLKNLYPNENYSKWFKLGSKNPLLLPYLVNSSKLHGKPQFKKHVHFQKTLETGGTTISRLKWKLPRSNGTSETQNSSGKR